MNTLQDRIRGSLIGGAGLIGLAILMLYLFCNLSTIMLTPRSDGCGEYYDLGYNQDATINWSGILFVIIPLIVMFYPWLKLFATMFLHRSREKYYGLFPATTKPFKIISAVLSATNVLSILWLVVVSSDEANVILNWESNYALCPDNSMFFTEYLLMIFSFWGLTNLSYEICDYYLNRAQNKR